jgi:exonuclease VII small subunit
MSKKDSTIEEKLLRLQEIQNLLQEKKVSLAESVRLLEEAVKLKLEIEQELQAIENRLHELDLSKTEQNVSQPSTEQLSNTSL